MARRSGARTCIDLGADAVIGHHAHEYQPVELYRGKPIVHGLGNFVFGTKGKSSMKFGLAAAISLHRGSISTLEITPLLTQNRIVNYQPRVPGPKGRNEFFESFLKQSKQLGAPFRRSGGKALLRFEPDSAPSIDTTRANQN